MGELLPELHLHGLAEGDFDLALRGLLGEDAPLSASTVARLKEPWQAEWEAWRRRQLEDLEPRKQITSGRPSRRGAKGRACKQAAETLGRDWDRMVTFSQFPQEHRVHLRTVNVVKSPFAALRLRTDAAKRSKRCDRLSAVIGKTLRVAERRFRRLNASAPAREGLRGRAVRGWSRGSPGGRRLMRKSTPLDETASG